MPLLASRRSCGTREDAQAIAMAALWGQRARTALSTIGPAADLLMAETIASHVK